MKDLIRIDFNNNLKVNSVDARELHKVLEVSTRFNDWIKARLDDTIAESNVDFFITEKKVTNNTEQLPSENVGGVAKNKAVNYKLSLNLAKEIAMLERNEVGKKVRKYFIQCESELLSKPKTVKRVKGDEPSDLNRLVNGLLERQIKHRKPCHFDYSNLAREVNIATFGHHEKYIRQHMTEDEAYVLRKKLTQAGLAIADGLSKPKEIGEKLRKTELLSGQKN
jgi:phage anti-repressor protein